MFAPTIDNKISKLFVFHLFLLGGYYMNVFESIMTELKEAVDYEKNKPIDTKEIIANGDTTIPHSSLLTPHSTAVDDIFEK